MTTFCLPSRRMCVTYILITYVRATRIEVQLNGFATTTQVQVAVDTFQCSQLGTYLMCYNKTILKTQATIHPKSANFLEIFSQDHLKSIFTFFFNSHVSLHQRPSSQRSLVYAFRFVLISQCLMGAFIAPLNKIQNSRLINSKILRIKNANFSGYYFYMNPNMQ